MVLGKGGYFRLGMGPKFRPLRRAENALNADNEFSCRA